MDQVQKRTCEKRFELRITNRQHTKLVWLATRLNRSGNALVRDMIDRLYEEEQKVMMIQAGFPDGRVP
jgi:predicted HicB family RNase H-like nuclease